MSSISSALNSYYNFFNSQSGSSASTPAVSTTTLADALNTLSTSSDSQDAYSVNLSSQAQALMSGSSTSTSSDSFMLTSAQQKTITDILAKYKDSPYTQDTYNSIMSDLKAAGVSPDQLSLMDKVTSFNPTGELMSALNGNSTDPLTEQANSAATQQTKSDNYVKSILSQWQKVSTTYSATESA